MAYRRKKATTVYRRRAPARRYRRRNNPNRPVRAIAAGNQQLPVPNRMIIKMRYCDQNPLDASGVAASTFTYALNGLFDPDVTTTGHQPMGFDQFAALYQQYKVLGARVTLEACGPPASSVSDQYIGIQFHENASYAPSVITQIIERGRERHSVIGNQTNRVKLVMNWSAKKWYGNNYKGMDTAGTISANPAELAYVSVFATRADNTENPDPITYVITIDYIVEWFGPLQMNQS